RRYSQRACREEMAPLHPPTALHGPARTERRHAHRIGLAVRHRREAILQGWPGRGHPRWRAQRQRTWGRGAFGEGGGARRPERPRRQEGRSEPPPSPPRSAAAGLLGRARARPRAGLLPGERRRESPPARPVSRVRLLRGGCEQVALAVENPRELASV